MVAPVLVELGRVFGENVFRHRLETPSVDVLVKFRSKIGLASNSDFHLLAWSRHKTAWHARV